MRRFVRFFPVFFIILFSCQKVGNPGEEQMPHLKELEQFARVISDTNLFPPVINPEYVAAHLDRVLVLDLRSSKDFDLGHIQGARNIKQSDMVNFLSFKVHPASYDDIVLVSQCGQGAVFASTILQLLGYNNVFALKYGIAGWNKSFSFYYKPIEYDGLDNYWESGKQHNVKTYSIDPSMFKQRDWKKRASKILAHSVKDFLIRADSALAQREKYTIIDYRSASVYERIHVKGAINYDVSQGFDNSRLLSLIPPDKPVIVYSCHPYNAISLMAYLRLLGYRSFAFSYGFHLLLHQRAGKPFDPRIDFKQLPVVTKAK